mmetsp:Transcript_2662/g.8971  ORF Transcript_2662/g.8971 Transcript_2662/m.8971 type:complete len:238 (-) Transcript_2662:2446-3159(-)
MSLVMNSSSEAYSGMSTWKKHVCATGSELDRGIARTCISKSRLSGGSDGEPVAKTRNRRSESLSNLAMARFNASGTSDALAKPTYLNLASTLDGVRSSSAAHSRTRQSVELNNFRNGDASGESSWSAATKPRRIASRGSVRQPTSAWRTFKTTNECLFASVTGRDCADASTSLKSKPQSPPSGGAWLSMYSSELPSTGSNFCRSRSARPSPAAACLAPCARYLKSDGPRRLGAPQPS